MRRTGHIRERSPGAFELRYSLGIDPATGRRRTATATVRGSRKDAERELRRLLQAVDTGEHVESEPDDCARLVSDLDRGGTAGGQPEDLGEVFRAWSKAS